MTGKRKIPRTTQDYAKIKAEFEAWLLAHGSALYKPTNAYELARFLTPDGIGIIYVNQSGFISACMNGANEAVRAWSKSTPWRAVQKTKRRNTFGSRERDYNALVERDGAGCFYCGTPLLLEFATIEHMIPVTSGGNNHLANKVLACHQHNLEAGHRSVREKLEMAMRIRFQKAQAAE